MANSLLATKVLPLRRSVRPSGHYLLIDKPRKEHDVPRAFAHGRDQRTIRERAAMPILQCSRRRQISGGAPLCAIVLKGGIGYFAGADGPVRGSPSAGCAAAGTSDLKILILRRHLTL